MPNKDQEEAAGSQPEVAFIIGTPNDFHEGKAHKYYKGTINKQTIYYSDKSSEWSRDVNEVLVLLRESWGWIAYDADVSFNWKRLHCRQPVFCCSMTDITQPGKYMWQTNWNANPNDIGLEPDWQDGPEAETRWPWGNDASCVETTQVVDTQRQLRSESFQMRMPDRPKNGPH